MVTEPPPTDTVADAAPNHPSCCCCRRCCHCCCCCCVRAAPWRAPAPCEPAIARSNSALSMTPSWLVSMAAKRSPPTCADLACCFILPPLEDSTWSRMGTSEQTDDAGEDETSELISERSETDRFLLLLLLFIWRVDFAALSFLQTRQMPKQKRQARSSRRGIHHHVRACS